jgi:putative NADH-flavin reductase
MQLTVFGATGKTGLAIVQQALAAGHTVTAFVRDPSRFAITDSRIRVCQGDIGDLASVRSALQHPADAVVSALGVFHREPKTVLSEGTANIISAMKECGLRRLVVVSSLGAGDSRGQGNFLARCIQRFILGHVLDDKTRQEQLIRESGLDWTVVRPPQLTDRQAICAAPVLWQGPAPEGVRLSWQTSRATIASLLLLLVTEGSHSGQALNVSEPK